jgi:hypothetical protein
MIVNRIGQGGLRKIFEVRLALHRPRRLTRVGHLSRQCRRQNAQNRNHNQQLDQRKPFD